MIKSELRREILSRRKSLTQEIRAEYSRIISQTLISLPEFIDAQTVHCYLSFGTEVETDIIRQTALRSQKKVAVPLHENNNSSLKHYFISENQAFTIGQWGVPIPICKESELLSSTELALSKTDIIIVPLVAFDRMKHRLGYGKGYYDRFLHNTDSLKIGLGFSIQEVENIPFESHDEFLSVIITESYIF